MVFSVREIPEFGVNEECVFCRGNTVDEFRLGKVYKFNNLIVHYYCLLFASHLQQNGNDKQGILGFLMSDIAKELRFKSNSICTYCRKAGAVSWCARKGCKVKFHLPCGIENLSFHEFFGQFRSYCFAHRRLQTPRVPPSTKLMLSSICVICQSDISPVPCLRNVWASCCKTAWFHKDCVQRLALSAGYFFKCPNCNNQKDFRKEMLACGIYIPDQDAAWELEPNSFHDLTERHNSCDADVCFCENGRNFARLRGRWRIILCNTCGSHGIHNYCGKLMLKKRKEWTCTICSTVPSTTKPSAPSCAKSVSPQRVCSVRENISTLQRKRHRRSSLPNNFSASRAQNERIAYDLRDLPKKSFKHLNSVYKNRTTIETYSLMNESLKRKEDKKEVKEIVKQKVCRIRRVKCSIDGTEVRIPTAYKKLLKDFCISVSDIKISRALPVTKNDRFKRTSTLPLLPKTARRYSMI